MTNKISDEQLLRLSELVARHLGLDFPRERWPDLQRGVCGAAQESGYHHNLDQYIQELLLPASPQRHLEVVADHLTVGETYFFREKGSLDAFEKDIVQELIRKRTRKEIRIWSAGCATGEEPYSIAITLSKLLPRTQKWNIEILATDLNSKSLQKASTGIYGEWSFRGNLTVNRNSYFEAVEGKRWVVDSAIKKMVRFTKLNLVDDFLPPPANNAGGFDVIFCRNVLMYFTPDRRRKVVRQLYQSLASDGWLIVSPAETSQELFSEFATVNLGGVTLYRKSNTQLPKTLTLPSVGSNENRFGARPAEQRLGNSELIIAPNCGQSLNQELHSENATPPFDGQAVALHEPGGNKDARRIAGTLLPQDGNDAQAMLLLARASANEGKLTAALAWCDKAIAADKMAAPGYYLRATILQEQGLLPEALFALKQTVYAEPRFVLGHFSLGNFALTHGKPGESEKHFENVLLLLAHYEPEDVVPESEGLSAGRLREIIVSQCRGVAPAVAGSELSSYAFHRAAKPGRNPARSR